MILMIDNFDSFCYNIYQYIKELGEDIKVFRNDSITIDEIQELSPEMILISPGPSSPKEAGISMEAIEAFKGKIPILGVCLGHQAIGEVFGGKVVKAKRPVHGHVYPINHDKKGVYSGINSPLNVTRYHSLIIERDTLPSCLEITSETIDGEIMGVRHKTYLIEGVQFHPEAILTEKGHEIFQNFIVMARRKK
ncbi:para-aminobenzoate synthetase component 2 [Acetoanaerobium pronyense]|uniref:Para-aminobenzoate synthetase component 2 n=1 Tax=Acetoanaerobium pronyense TaxID=1482736 RepID=A0ABS4KG78_9FIRM|nr:aminodeoxychorismate/anthranilate synthase component II [Acetoanaerobium pronyense]MBP2026370.1 para-aminobenzoate synthetase component 2 [Acetoanaerobium pronyense]